MWQEALAEDKEIERSLDELNKKREVLPNLAYDVAIVMSEFGLHEVTIQGDTVYVAVHGEWQVSGMIALLELMRRTKEAQGACYAIVDTTDGLLIRAEVRKAIGEYIKRTSFRPNGTFVVGASLGARAVLKLVSRVVTLLTGIQRETHFVDTRQEAATALEHLRRLQR